jgi:phosphoglycolate phosphatase-like HAD superfamily hydrolase
LRGAVFDWDGTLVDIDEREFYCINQTLRARGVSPVTHDFFIHNYYRRPFDVTPGGGTGPRMVLEAAMAGRKANLDELYEAYRKLFGETIDKAKLQDGALELLRLLKDNGYKVGIATMRYTRSVVDRELEAFGVDSLAGVLLTREDLGFRRALGSLEETVEQRVQLVATALKKLGLGPEESFLVGDSWWDIRAGKRVGMKTVLILTGFSLHNDFSAERPDITVKSLRELETKVRNGEFSA